MRGEIITFSFREGGGYRMRLSYEEPQHARGKTSEDADEVEVRFIKLLADQQIEQVVEFDSEQAEFAGSMNMTWNLAASGKGTQVTVHCTNVPSGIGQDDHEAGLTSTLDNLAEFMKQTERAE
jgi:uncharacterized protein YndB with AHSA1/START domain